MSDAVFKMTYYADSEFYLVPPSLILRYVFVTRAVFCFHDMCEILFLFRATFVSAAFKVF